MESNKGRSTAEVGAEEQEEHTPGHAILHLIFLILLIPILYLFSLVISSAMYPSRDTEIFASTNRAMCDRVLPMVLEEAAPAIVVLGAYALCLLFFFPFSGRSIWQKKNKRPHPLFTISTIIVAVLMGWLLISTQTSGGITVGACAPVEIPAAEATAQAAPTATAQAAFATTAARIRFGLPTPIGGRVDTVATIAARLPPTTTPTPTTIR